MCFGVFLGRPILEYVVQFGTLIMGDELEKVQKRATRFITRNYTYEKGRPSMTGILKTKMGIPAEKKKVK